MNHGRHVVPFSDWIAQRSVRKPTSKNCSKVRAARAARLFFLIRPIRSLFSGVAVAVAVVQNAGRESGGSRFSSQFALRARCCRQRWRQFEDLVGEYDSTITWDNMELRTF